MRFAFAFLAFFCIAAFAEHTLQPRFDEPRRPAALQFDPNGIPIVTVLFNGRPIEVGVDTGAGMTVLTESAALLVGVRNLKAAWRPVHDTLGAPMEARVGVADVEVAGMAIASLPVLVLPDERLQVRSPRGKLMFRFDGLLGWNAIEKSRMTLDYGARELRFEPPARECGERNLWSRRHRPYVRYEADGETAQAFVDTGARTSVLVGPLPPDAREQRRLIAGASGTTIRREALRTGVTFTAGGQRWENLTIPTVESMAQENQGAVLGSDLFAGRRVQIDATCGSFSVGAR